MRLTWKKMPRDGYLHDPDHQLRLKGVCLAIVAQTKAGWYWYGSAPGKPGMNSLWETDPAKRTWETLEEAKAACKAAIKAQFEEGS